MIVVGFLFFTSPFAFLLICGIDRWIQSRSACQWPKVEGMITKSELKTYVAYEGITLVVPDTYVSPP